MENFFLALFLIFVGLSGLACLIDPERIVAFRRARGWNEGWLSGGIFYSTRTRAGATGIILTVIALVAGALAIAGRP
jgi:hypothetical protein